MVKEKEKSSVSRSLPFIFNEPSALPIIQYDDIVDRTEFKTALEKDRNFRIGSEKDGGGFVSGQYDSQDNSIPKNMPSPTEIQLRTGLVSDPADLDTLQKLQVKSAQKEFDQNVEKSKADKQKKISDARQGHLDSLSGFDSSTVK